MKSKKKKAIVEILIFLWTEYGDEEALEAMKTVAMHWGDGYIKVGDQDLG